MKFNLDEIQLRSIHLKTATFLLACLLVLLAFGSCDFTAKDESNDISQMVSVIESEISSTVEKKEYKAVNYDYMKAMWLSQYDMQSVYRDGQSQRSLTSFRLLADKVISNIADSGYNTVVIQVRPFADSFYPSELYPPSSFVTGSYSKGFNYDPFEILIELAHKKNLSVHAWINPMRGMIDAQLLEVSSDYAIKKWYNDSTRRGKYIVKSGTGNAERWYLNPAYAEVRQLIADGAAEIVKRYDVDGVHMDDYFYPTKETSFDSASFSDYKKDGGKLSLDNYRRDNVSVMVALINSSVKAVSADVPFGISPAGVFNTTYNDLYADVVKWCEEPGYIDYIVPQIYFGLEHQTYDFISVYRTWQKLKKHENLKYCVGISLGKAKSGVDNYAGTGKLEWSEHDDIIKRCLEYLDEREDNAGLFVFCYQYYFDPVTGKNVSETNAERENMAPVFARLGEAFSD